MLQFSGSGNELSRPSTLITELYAEVALVAGHDFRRPKWIDSADLA